MKSDELLAKLAEINEKYGPVPVRVYDSDYYNNGEDTTSWETAEITEVRVDGMEVGLWV